MRVSSVILTPLYGLLGACLTPLASWVGAACQLLDPLIHHIRDHILCAAKIHADDTPVPVLAPGHGRTRTGRLWTYVRDDRPADIRTAPAVWFAYSPDRRGEHPQRHLCHFKGTLQADAYAGFQDLYKDGRIREAACWAHARRKFHDILIATQSPIATEAVHRIGALYAIEKEIRGSTTEIRHCVRQARRNHCSKNCTSGSRPRLDHSRARAIWRQRSVMRSFGGLR